MADCLALMITLEFHPLFSKAGLGLLPGHFYARAYKKNQGCWPRSNSTTAPVRRPPRVEMDLYGGETDIDNVVGRFDTATRSCGWMTD